MTPFEEQIKKEITRIFYAHDRKYEGPDPEPFIQDVVAFVSRQRTALVKEIKRRKKRPSDVIQLMVTEQGTAEGKLHYQREYGRIDGYNSALNDLTAFLTGRISVQTPQ